MSDVVGKPNNEMTYHELSRTRGGVEEPAPGNLRNLNISSLSLTVVTYQALLTAGHTLTPEYLYYRFFFIWIAVTPKHGHDSPPVGVASLSAEVVCQVSGQEMMF